MLMLFYLIFCSNPISQWVSVRRSNPFELVNSILIDASSCSFMLFPNIKFSCFAIIDVNLYCIVDFYAWGFEILSWHMLLSLFSGSFFCFRLFNYLFIYWLLSSSTFLIVQDSPFISNRVLASKLIGKLTFFVLFCFTLLILSMLGLLDV